MRSSSPHAVYTDNAQKVVLIGVAADSGCGKSTFMRRLTSIFGGDTVGPLGGGFENGGWETNSLVSDLTTVLCLDDYHLNDRGGRKVPPFAFFVVSRLSKLPWSPRQRPLPSCHVAATASHPFVCIKGVR